MKNTGACEAEMCTGKEFSVRVLKDAQTEGLWHWVATSHQKTDLFGMGQERTEQDAWQGAAECLNRLRRIAIVARAN